MAKRFFVCRAYVKWKGKMYRKGDLFPPEFTRHDKARSVYNSRIGECEVEEESISAKEPTPITTPLTGQVTGDTALNSSKTEDAPVSSPVIGVTSADKHTAPAKFTFTTTGTQK